MSFKPNLMVPLNNWKSINSNLGVLKNADEVYFGLESKFSMRARAGNFSMESLPKLVKIVHDSGKRIFLCTNIVIYDNELDELKTTIELAKSYGIDAVICHDFATINIAKGIGLDFHISTQCNISNVQSAEFYKQLGAKRINLSRELSLNQIDFIIKNVQIPVETFIHGAMCSSISGRCYLSSELMKSNPDFSANRGKCIQPCRRIYRFLGEEGEEIQYEPNSGMFFNAMDLCMIEHLDQLIKLNIAAFKIEGRMRDPLYIAETASCYREAIDSLNEGTYTKYKLDNWVKRLNNVYNRGFHTGFYFQIPDQNAIELNTRGNISSHKREHLGKVLDYDFEAKRVKLEIYKGIILTGQEVIFEDDDRFFYKQVAEKISMNNKLIKSSPLATSKEHVLIEIESNTYIPKNCKFYILKNYDG